MALEAGGWNLGSERDRGVRPKNEDYVSIQILPFDTPSGVSWFAMVADGMGGLEKGWDASQWAVKTIETRLLNDLGSSQLIPFTHETLECKFREIVNGMNGEFLKKYGDGGTRASVGTTLLAALGFPDGVLLLWGGDSTAWGIDAEGKIALLTAPHSKGKALTNRVGKSDFYLDSRFIPLGDSAFALLLCTDGITDVLNSEGLLRVFNRKDDCQEIAMGLVQEALQRRTQDNCSIVVAEFGKVPRQKANSTVGPAPDKTGFNGLPAHRKSLQLLPPIMTVEARRPGILWWVAIGLLLLVVAVLSGILAYVWLGGAPAKSRSVRVEPVKIPSSAPAAGTAAMSATINKRTDPAPDPGHKEARPSAQRKPEHSGPPAGVPNGNSLILTIHQDKNNPLAEFTFTLTGISEPDAAPQLLPVTLCFRPDGHSDYEHRITVMGVLDHGTVVLSSQTPCPVTNGDVEKEASVEHSLPDRLDHFIGEVLAQNWSKESTLLPLFSSQPNSERTIALSVAAEIHNVGKTNHQLLYIKPLRKPR